MISRTVGKIILSICLLGAAACQHTEGQNRIVVSDPAAEGPTVIQIQPQSGDSRSIQITGNRSGFESLSNSSAIPSPGTVQSVIPGQPTQISPQVKTQEPQVVSLPAPASQRAPLKHSYNSVKTTHPVVAMTFDDGPHPELTPKLLDLLKARNIRATFYVIGKNVAAYPEIARRIVEEGHEIANHTYTHPALSKIGAARVKTELDRTTEAIRQATGVTPRNMRPPYGATNTALNRRISEEFGMPVIMWSVDPQDWRYRNASRVSSHIIANAKPGDIILAHDIHPSTIAAMAPALDALLAKGFRFVTVSELLEYDAIPVSTAAVTETASGSPAQAPAPTN